MEVSGEVMKRTFFVRWKPVYRLSIQKTLRSQEHFTRQTFKEILDVLVEYLFASLSFVLIALHTLLARIYVLYSAQ